MQAESNYVPVAIVRHRRLLWFIFSFAGVICAIELARGESLSEVAALFALLVFVLASAFTWQAVIDGVGPLAFWKAVFKRADFPIRAVLEYEIIQPAKQVPTYEMQRIPQGSFGRRFLALCIILALACAFIAAVNGPRDGGEEAALWTFGAIVVLGVGGVLAVLKWLFTGRL